MSAIPSPALALARAFDRFERSGARALNAAQNGDERALISALTDQIEAKVQARAGLATVRFADEMFQALLDIHRAR